MGTSAPLLLDDARTSPAGMARSLLGYRALGSDLCANVVSGVARPFFCIGCWCSPWVALAHADEQGQFWTKNTEASAQVWFDSHTLHILSLFVLIPARRLTFLVTQLIGLHYSLYRRFCVVPALTLACETLSYLNVVIRPIYARLAWSVHGARTTTIQSPRLYNKESCHFKEQDVHPNKALPEGGPVGRIPNSSRGILVRSSLCLQMMYVGC